MESHFIKKLTFVFGALLAFLTVAGGFHIYQTWASSTVDYSIVYSPSSIQLAPSSTSDVWIIIQNLSPEIWNGDDLRLGTVYTTGDKDRPSIWVGKDWLTSTRIAASDTGNVRPLRRVEFHFQIQAPSYTGLYKEYFQPVLEYTRWLTGEPIVLTLRVGEPQDPQIQEVRDREIKIYRNTQIGDMVESGFIVASLPISTGRSGYTTPAGQYKIFNHIDNAYSSEYELWMPNWMGLASLKYGFQGYGLHGLPYWHVNPARYEEGKIYPGGRMYTQGKLYEGYEHLGIPISHGCIRFGVRESEVLYQWADNGTPVTVI